MRFALLMGALMEGTSLCGPWPKGDNGEAHGPFQIHIKQWHITEEQANDPAFAVNFAINRLGYAQTVAKQGELWIHDPLLAAAQAIYEAEKPAYFYPASVQRWALREILNAGIDLSGLGVRQFPTPTPTPTPQPSQGPRIPLPGPLPDIPVPERPDNLPNLLPFMFPLIPPFLLPGGQSGGVPSVREVKTFGEFLNELTNPDFWKNRVLPFGIGLIALTAGIWMLMPDSARTMVVTGVKAAAL